MLRRVRAAAVPAALARCTQFQRTSEMGIAANKGDKETLTKWVIKSTREFEPAKKAVVVKIDSSPEKREGTRSVLAQKEAVDQTVINAEKFAQNEIDRIWDFKRGKVRKYREFFSRHGWAYAGLYLFLYFTGLGAFWFVLHYQIVEKTAFFELVFSMTMGYVERKSFFERVDAWNDYIDFGFAFTLNEVLDVVRIPLSLMIYYTFRRVLTKWRPSIFKMNAPEK